MPLVAYQRAHGSNDFPLHFAFFEAMEARGMLDRITFALDPMLDATYCAKLMLRFPQLVLTETACISRRAMRFLSEYIGRAYRPLAFLGTFDAVCEAPGGRINPHYSTRSLFHFYPRTRRRAILFHSIEAAAMQNSAVSESVGSCDLVIARTKESARLADKAGAKQVIEAADIVFRTQVHQPIYKPGLAVALRVPAYNPPEEFIERTRCILNDLESLGRPIDHTRTEEPIGAEMIARGYGTDGQPRIGLYGDDAMYVPFQAKRDLVISARLHTTLLAILYGNRHVLQYQIEQGTNKIAEIWSDLGLHALRVLPPDEVTRERVNEFISNPTALPEDQVQTALTKAREKVENGLDAVEEWLCRVK